MLNKEDFYRLIESRKSIRKFKKDMPPREVIDRILGAGLHAPSGKNRQNWKFFVVTGAKRDEYLKYSQKSWQGIKDILQKRLKPSLYDFTERFFYTLGEAPIFIFCYSVNSADERYHTSIGSVYMAVENINLACVAEGLGCCTMGAPLEIKDEVDEFLGVKNLPEYKSGEMELLCGIVMGYPDHNPPKAPRQTEGRITLAINLLEQLQKNPFVLAPMAGITDCAFRHFMKKRGASVVVTELVSSHGIEYGSERTLDLMKYDETQRPVGIQIFGEEPEILGRAAKFVEQQGADFVDLNFGCPVPKVVKKGAGSAVLKDLDQLKRILAAVKGSVSIPVTIKIRTGWDQATRNAEKVCQVAYDEGITWVAIHGRTRAQGYSGEADWAYIAETKKHSKVPVLGNGDIANARMAVNRLKESGCDGLLIGRGCLKNPYIFLESLSLLEHGEVQSGLRQDFSKLWLELRQTLGLYCDESLTTLQLRKFASWFSAGYPGAAQFRKSIFQCQGIDDVWSLSLEFFESISFLQQEDTSGEAFLMGGHG